MKLTIQGATFSSERYYLIMRIPSFLFLDPEILEPPCEVRSADADGYELSLVPGFKFWNSNKLKGHVAQRHWDFVVPSSSSLLLWWSRIFPYGSIAPLTDYHITTFLDWIPAYIPLPSSTKTVARSRSIRRRRNLLPLLFAAIVATFTRDNRCTPALKPALSGRGKTLCHHPTLIISTTVSR
jgi:hypothetical protein